MEYENRIVCYFDILGFSEVVGNKTLDAKEINGLFLEIKEIISENRNDDILISHFSDSFVISIKYLRLARTQLKFVIDVLLKLLEYSLIARGAIVYGEIIHTEENVFGPALVKAARLEKKAIFPRILLDDSLNELIIPTIGNTNIDYTRFFTGLYLKTDSYDKECYVDFMGRIKKQVNSASLNENIETLISNGLQNTDDHIHKKYEWLNEKYQLG